MALKSVVRKVYQKLVPARLRTRVFGLRSDLAVRVGQSCDVCHGRSIEPFSNYVISRLPYRFYRCRNCAFIFVYPKPNPEEVYGDAEVIEMGAGESDWNSHFLDRVEKYTDGRGRLLEVGFGDADFLRLAHERGWEVFGTEMSDACVRRASEELGLPNIRRGSVEGLDYPDNHFSIVAAFKLIEHVTDLRATLAGWRRILRPGGLLILICPNIEGIYHRLVPELFGDNDPLNITWVPPYHLSYFNKFNFKQLLEDTGFKVVGDESSTTPALWRQFEVSMGPRETDAQMSSLMDAIKRSDSPAGKERDDEFASRIVELLRRRLGWKLVNDVMKLEGALESENGILFVSRKIGDSGESGLQPNREDG